MMAKPASARWRASFSRQFQARARGIARPDDRHHRRRQRAHLAADGDERRRIVDHLRAQRIGRFTEGNKCDTELVRSGDFA